MRTTIWYTGKCYSDDCSNTSHNWQRGKGDTREPLFTTMGVDVRLSDSLFSSLISLLCAIISF
ncbi:hypothetical protein E2C01_044043 [Portunus trituberculatus]|uniref:Uncharacterized protein n=1 Tax=Portunus trituberculatus TaxID=210409 RepID=A0A5B7FS31_PORTR|nr:hypothetical protein [Portunus trituberculatus]